MTGQATGSNQPNPTSTIDIEVAPGVTLAVDVSGTGPAVLLVHGFPHTRALWAHVTPALARAHRVIAPDLRGIGDSTRASNGYDAQTLASDLKAVLDTCDVDQADLVAIDAGVPPAFLLAMGHPQRVRRLVLMEATLGPLPGAEDFFAAGAPWWFGFHQAPGLVEDAVKGNEGAYLDFFYRAGMHGGRDIDPQIRDRFVAAYSGTESLLAGVGTYRAMAESNAQLAAAAATSRLSVPTLAIGSHPVGDSLFRQLQPIADELRGELIEDCGHIIPLDRPDKLLALVQEFLR